ncbi:hyaluronan-mediated motility receptor-like [Lineus longissimus]|uniref:hyaluronan-mediated motility receptor-like n=1 Tax=Lineus longissimus TaxID=88925 RepID=UPI00315DF46E
MSDSDSPAEDLVNNKNADVMRRALLKKMSERMESLPEGDCLGTDDSDVEENAKLNRTSDSFKIADDGLVETLKNELAVAKAFIEHLRKQKVRQRKRMRSVEMQLNEFDDYRVHLKTDLVSMNETINKHKETIRDLEKQLTKKTNSECSLMDEIELLKLEIACLKDNKKGLDDHCKEQENKQRILQTQLHNYSDRCEFLERENDDLKSRVYTAENDNAILKSRVQDMEGSILEFSMSRQQLLQQQLMALKQTIRDVEAQKGTLEQQLKLKKKEPTTESEPFYKDKCQMMDKDFVCLKQQIKALVEQNIQLQEKIDRQARKIY